MIREFISNKQNFPNKTFASLLFMTHPFIESHYSADCVVVGGKNVVSQG